MGPLVPFGIIGPEFSYIVALFIGFAFGFILEQAGFSTSRKLVGVFYGYDFVVLRVFFTAAATAAVGLILMDYFKLIDFDFLYINPMFIWPAIVGGAIMGFGFILGGFCPGTSIVAASVGKLDAMVFILGSFFGIILFAELFPIMSDFFVSGDIGKVFVYESLGISRGLFAFALVLIAMIAFVVTSRIEKNVSYGIRPKHPKYKMAVPALFVGTIAAIVVLLLPASRQGVLDMPKDKFLAEYNSGYEFVSPEEVAFDIYKDLGKLYLIDVRKKEYYEEYCLTGAIRVDPENIDSPVNEPFFTHPTKKPVLYCNNETMAKKAYVLAKDAGYDNVAILKGGINGFKAKMYDDRPNTAAFIGDFNPEFWTEFRTYIESDSTLTKPVKKPEVKVEVIKVQGGC